ncbi:glycosyltransferase [Mitsuaria sp. GD03876]|uniref:glycosyltransferase n=1 Tax=Mitsuaria sp. GD03876 TaxID=2975399 RepID=UPI002448CC37|nr:glycosyltransferase [Mitsuaria sp. GD03876]MDH0865135.1 glycosyltransferase [Mitsuaria sp. GD03876]
MPSRWRTCLVVIARNEAATIARLLDSVRPHVDELLVMDTGSTDETVRLAQAAGARVGHFAWIDDFSAARNAALDAAGADWHLVLDADEWLTGEGSGAALEALRSTAPDFVGTIALEDRFDGGTARSRLSRVLPGAVRYAGRIHEQPSHALPVWPLDVHVAHDGYLPERLAGKRGRNEALLLAAVQDDPANPYLWYQLGKDFSVYDRFAQAEEAFAIAAERLTSMPLPPAWWNDLVARRLFGLKSLKRHADGLVFAEAQLQRCAESPDFFFALGDLLLDWAADEPAQAEVLLPMIEDAWRRCLEIGERPDQPGAVAGRGSHLASHNLALLSSILQKGQPQ